MKKIGIVLIGLISALFWSKIIIADTVAFKLGSDIIGLDSDRNGTISITSILNGQDVFLVRETAPNEPQSTNVQRIGTPDGKTYVPLTVEDLLKLANNKQHALTADDIKNLKLHIYTARYLEGTDKIIVERDISNNIQSIRLVPNPSIYATTVNIADASGNNIMTKVITPNVTADKSK